ncbi:hypothetical protein Plec18167_006742 [Paecilomyces lecythidis]|uniref:Alcohol dehydrogenase-like C-terminal domain-containing protein n=1 Tax=Paecilomyces lecythidis TaxID=3004212 RepID=A0ABR3XAH8_9EURO
MGQTVVIFGAGAVGLAAVMAAKLTPARMVIAVDLVTSKLIKARDLGATHTINANETDTLAQIRSLTDGFGVDRTMDTTGNIQVIKTMIDCAAPGGLVATVGAPKKGQIIEIEPATWLTRGISYMGVHQGSSDPQEFIPYLVQLWEDGRFPVDRLVNTFSYKEMREATDALRKGICIKAVLLWDE